MADDDAASIISHFSHPEHELVKRHYIGPFLCDMCWEDLSGPAYGCTAGCDFAVHDTCAGHPQTLLSPEHHPHELVLEQTPHLDDGSSSRFTCDVCAGACASGCFLYRCPPCDFDVHPRCLRLPPVVRGTRHEHDLTLVAAGDDDEGRRRCAACHKGGAWYYSCTVCGDLDFHVSCAAAGGGGAVENDAAAAACGGGDDPAGELLLARINAQRDISYKLAVANIQAMGAASIAELASGGRYRYRTRRFY
jgi:hypothetical protein